MKRIKFFNVVLILMFIAMITIPTIFTNFHLDKISEVENRMLANFPKVYNGDQINKNFIKEFESWFNDNIGFRDKIAKVSTKLQYDLFGKVAKNDIILGKNDWIYYVTPDIIKDYQNLNIPTSAQLEKYNNFLDNIDNYLKNKDIPFITMLCLDKKTIYPENYSDGILKVGKESRTKVFSEYIEQNSDIDFFTPYDELINAKKTEVVYSPRYDNAHWNKAGAMIGYNLLMQKVKKYIPDIKILSSDEFDINEYEREVSIYGGVNFKETDKNFALKSGYNTYQEEAFSQKTGLNLSYRFINNNKNLPKALIFGDSYLYSFILPEVAESFSELTFIHSEYISKMQSMVEIYSPDIVIFENVERMMFHTLERNNNEKMFLEEYSYEKLPVNTNTEGVMWLDYANSILVQQQGVINIDSSNPIVRLDGWALDPISQNNASGIYVKVGEKYYTGKYEQPRQSVVDAFGNPNYLNSGFVFEIKTEDIINNNGEFSFIIVSKDKTYQYEPITYKAQY